MTSPPVSSARPRLASVRRLSHAVTSDAALARAAVDADPGAAALIWDRYSALVRGVLRRSLRPEGEVEDQVQEVFLRFFRRPEALRDPSALKSFLIGISVRVAVSELRRRRVRRWLRLADEGTLPEGPASGVTVDDDAREALGRLYALLDRVDDQARLAFVLRNIEGLELTEVAEALGLSLATTKRRLASVSTKVNAMARRDAVLCAYLTSEPPETGECPDG